MKFLIVLGIYCLSPSAVFCEGDEGPLVLNLETAIPLVLSQNRQLLNAVDNLIRIEYQVSVAASDFDLQIRPNGDFGYIGGGTAGTGPTFGTAIEFSKKLACGTRISVTPSFLKANDKYHSNVRTYIATPLLRGFGSEFSQAHLLGTLFGYRSAQRSFHLTQCQLIFRTIASLYDVVKAEKSIQLNEESYRRVRKFYQAAQIKARIGMSDSLDLYRAEIELRQAEDSLKASKERLQESYDVIRDILALETERPIVVQMPLIYTKNELTTEQAVELSLTNRMELDQANDQLQENERISRYMKDRLWPELNLVINYSNVAQDQVFTETWLKKRESSWGVGFTTSSDFNPVADSAAYEQSLLGIDAATRGVDQTIANLTFEVKRSLRNLERTLQRIELQEKQMKSSEGELRLTQIKFERGMGNSFDLIHAERSLSVARLSYWHAIIDHIVGEYHFRSILGLLVEKPPL